MNARELIELLRKHPKVCEILGIAILSGTSYGADDFAVYVESGRFAFGGQSLEEPLRTFRRWLTGACVEWCDAQGWDTYIASNGHGAWTVDDTGEDRKVLAGAKKDRLHAMLAAMEAT